MNIQTVYKRIGGAEAVDFLAEDFTHRVISTNNLAHLYEGYNLENLTERHKEWVTHILGENREDPFALRYVNRKFVDERGITNEEYGSISSILIEVLDDYHFSIEEKSRILSFLSENIDICLHRD